MTATTMWRPPKRRNSAARATSSTSAKQRTAGGSCSSRINTTTGRMDLGIRTRAGTCNAKTATCTKSLQTTRHAAPRADEPQAGRVAGVADRNLAGGQRSQLHAVPARVAAAALPPGGSQQLAGRHVVVTLVHVSSGQSRYLFG